MTLRNRSANIGGAVITATGITLSTGTDLSRQADDTYLQANTARNTANDAYGQANTATTIGQNAYNAANNAYGQANTARTTANNAYDQANLAYTQANTARSDANITFTTINSTFSTVNTSITNAHNQANAAFGQANTGTSIAQSAYGQANLAYTQANTARSDANTTFATINSTFGTVNTAVTNAHNQANAAFNAANGKLSLTGGAIVGDISVTGNLFVNGTETIVNTSSLTINDPIFLLANNNTTNAVGLGFVAHYGPTQQHTGLVRAHQDNNWYLFENYDSHILYANNVLDLSNIKLATLRANVNANSLLLVGNAVATQANLTLAHNQANAARSDANTTFATINSTFGTVNTNITNTFTVSFTSNINASTDRTPGSYGSYASSATNTPTNSGILLNLLSGSGGTSDGWQLWTDYNVNGNLYTRRRWGGTYSSWAKIWGESNDGSGSGLDADLWDGYQFADYLNQAVKTTSSPTFTGLTVSNTITGSINGSAGSVAWTGITSKPTTLSGFGITNGLVRGGPIGNIDYNTQRTLASGIYSVDAAPTNGPPGGAYSNFIQMYERFDTSAQLVIDYSTGTLYTRGIQTAVPSYSPWRTNLHDGNYNGYSPTLTGTGASGTWGISVTGTARGLDSSHYISRTGSSGNLNTDFSNTPAGTTRISGDDANVTNGAGNAWWFYQHMRHSNASNMWGTQVAWGWEDNALRLAQRNISGGTFSAWVYYLNSNNYTTYAPSLTGTGASGTWGISITGNAATVTDGMYLASAQTVSGRKVFNANQNVGSMLNAGGSLGGLEAVNTGGANAAFMSFHRAGAYASYFGLDTDNQFAVGGWSAGAGLASFKCNSLGVGTAASGTAGEIRATNNVTAYYSDARLKDFKGKINNALEKVNKLNGYYYVENEVAEQYGYNNKQEQVGVSAQEVEAVLPHIVTRAPFDIAKNEDGTEYSKSGEDYKTVRYERLVPLLIEAIKELKQEIEVLKQR
jgi:hypothetical protein